MLSSPGGLDTGAHKQGASQTSQSQVKDNETKTKSTVSIKPFSPHHFSGNLHMLQNAHPSQYQTQTLDPNMH
jgi:hypothetical protein